MKKPTTENTITIKGFKAFNTGLICRGFRYKENEIFEHKGSIEVCNEGFHFCENPFDVLNHYPLIGSEFATVEALGSVDKEKENSGDNKICTSKIKIGAKLELKGFVKACIDFMFEKTKSSGDRSQLASSGDYSQLDITGENSVAANIGKSGMVKGIIGTWITLAEHDDDGVCVYVKSAQIDGKELKADTWYKLKNKKFVEV